MQRGQLHRRRSSSRGADPWRSQRRSFSKPFCALRASASAPSARTRFTHFTKVKSDYTLVKCPSLLEEGEEYKEGINKYSRAGARDNGLIGNKKLRAKAHSVKRRLARRHWDNCKVRFDEAVVFSFAASALTAGFLEADIIAAYDRALHKNHARATDRGAIWDNGSTVSDARQLLARTSRRFEPGQVDPEIAHKVRESLLSASASGRPKEADPTSTTDRTNNRFPAQ